MTLEKLGKKYGTDKYDHGFLPFYAEFFDPIREEVRSILEIGIADGASIRMWLDYFPNARVFGLDAPGNVPMRYGDANKWPSHARFIALRGDQGERFHLKRLLPSGPWDIIIDDGGHTMEQQQVSLGALFPACKQFYVVEDLHTSFMDRIHISDGRSYETGAENDARQTTNRVLVALQEDVLWDEYGVEGKPCYLSTDELDVLHSTPTAVHIFDRDGDHKHMAAVIQKGGADG